MLLGMLMLSACLVRADVVSRITMPASDEIHCMYFDHQGLLWIGQRKGISVLHPNGKGFPVYIIDKEFSTKGNFLVNHLMEDHLGDSDFNRDVFASEMNMSLSALYKKLRNLTGLSVQTYISTIRLNAAREILNQDPNIRISELAYRVGFNTPKYFSQCFKKEFGMLPGEFAKQQS